MAVLHVQVTASYTKLRAPAALSLQHRQMAVVVLVGGEERARLFSLMGTTAQAGAEGGAAGKRHLLRVYLVCLCGLLAPIKFTPVKLSSTRLALPRRKHRLSFFCSPTGLVRLVVAWQSTQGARFILYIFYLTIQ